jgi:hypothetical protein
MIGNRQKYWRRPLSSFAHVPLLRAIGKKSGLTMREVLGKINSHGRFDHKFSVDVESESGEVYEYTIMWHMSLRSPKPHNWQMSLLLHNIRFDCVDHEWTVQDHRGHKCQGWHRHIWDMTCENCERKKECLDGFGTHRTFSEFIQAGCAMLGILLEDGGETDESSYLQFD